PISTSDVDSQNGSCHRIEASRKDDVVNLTLSRCRSDAAGRDRFNRFKSNVYQGNVIAIEGFVV
ncbi:MAG: hypothetical protein RMJ60_03795, partial [Anaerolineales bacterium]|nr:hypothetical protein [Anaerolineales bacterium]